MNYAKALAICGAAVVAAASIGITAAPVHARTAQPVTVTGHRGDVAVRYVGYADLNLASAGDEAVLKGRVRFAVNDVCDEVVGHASRWEFRGCTYESWADARPQIARAVRRAREIALTGSSPIAAVAITINLSH